MATEENTAVKGYKINFTNNTRHIEQMQQLS